MSTLEDLRLFISLMPADQVFTTRSLLHISTRTNIDSCLCKMTRKGEIIRLARGIFIQREGYFNLPATLEITMVKTYKRKLDIPRRVIDKDPSLRHLALADAAAAKSQHHTQSASHCSTLQSWRICGKEIGVAPAERL
jgi:hypothetical protein